MMGLRLMGKHFCETGTFQQPKTPQIGGFLFQVFVISHSIVRNIFPKAYYLFGGEEIFKGILIRKMLP